MNACEKMQQSDFYKKMVFFTVIRWYKGRVLIRKKGRLIVTSNYVTYLNGLISHFDNYDISFVF